MAEPRYLTPDEFRARLTAGETEPGTDTSIPTHWEDADLARFILDAESEVETRVRVRYAVPLPTDPVAPVVLSLVTAIAAYHAMLAQRKNSDFTGELDPYLLRYRSAVDLLDRIADGRADIPDADRGFGAAVYDPRPGRMFTPDMFGLPSTARAEGGEVRMTDRHRYRR